MRVLTLLLLCLFQPVLASKYENTGYIITLDSLDPHKLTCRNHYNRTCSLRYTCDTCHDISFDVAADLKRHKKSVHQQFLGSDETYQCTIPGCLTPDKIFDRKDNFNRHMERCRRRIAEGNVEERAEYDIMEE